MPKVILHKESSVKNIQPAGNIELVHSGEDYFFTFTKYYFISSKVKASANLYF